MAASNAGIEGDSSGIRPCASGICSRSTYIYLFGEDTVDDPGKRPSGYPDCGLKFVKSTGHSSKDLTEQERAMLESCLSSSIFTNFSPGDWFCESCKVEHEGGNICPKCKDDVRRWYNVRRI